MLKESCGYAEATMYLYNITGEDSSAAKKFLPQSRSEAHFFVNHSFSSSRDDSLQYAFEAMETIIDDKKQVMGSFIYESSNSADLVLNFFSASLDD